MVLSQAMKLTSLLIMPTLRQLFPVLGLFCASLCLFVFGLSSQEVIGFDSRFYLFALEMHRYGLTWFPTTYGQPYPDYPAASIILMQVAAFFLGMNKLTVILPTAIMAAITVSMTYLIGALRDVRWGWYGALFVLLTVAFFSSARAITLDMYPAAITAICFYLIDKANTEQRKVSYWFYILLVTSFIFRGPIGLVIPTGVAVIYYLCNKQYKQCVQVGITAFILLVLCTAALLMLANVIGGHAFLTEVLNMEVLGRLEQGVPRYFYFTAGMTDYALSFPIALFVVIGGVYYVLRGEEFAEAKYVWLFVAWVLVVLLGMSVPGDKKIRYVLAITPALSLLAAYPFAIRPTQRYFIILRWLGDLFFLIFPGLLLIASAFVQHDLRRRGWDISIPVSVMIFFGAMQLLSFICYITTIRETGLLPIAVLSFAVMMIGVVEPIILQTEKTRDFVVFAENARANANAGLVFYHENRDGMPIKYLINASVADPVFVKGEKSLLTLNTPVFVVTSESYFNDLSPSVIAKFRIVAKGKVGHVDVVVLEKIAK